MNTANENTATNGNGNVNAPIGDNNPPTNAVLNAALIDMVKASTAEQGAGFRFAVALFEYRTALAHSLSDMVHNRTVYKRDKKTGKTGTDLASVTSLHKSFLETLPAYNVAVKEAEGVKLDVYTAMDSDKVAAVAAKKENAKTFINKTRVAVTRAVSIAYFLDAIEAREVSVEKTGKEMSYEFPSRVTDKDGKETITWKRVHFTFTRLLNLSEKYIADKKVKPARVTPSVQSADTGTAPKLEGEKVILDTAGSLVDALESATGENKQKLSTAEPTERLICAALAARFGKRSKMGVLTSMDIGEVFNWLKTQSYFKEATWTGHASTAEIIRQPRKILAKK